VRHCRVSSSRQRCQSGTITIEFAMIFPAIVGIMFAIIDAGRFVGARLMLTQAVSEGVRVASLSTTTTDAAVDSAVHGAGTMLGNLVVTTPVGCLRPDLVTVCTMGTKAIGDRLTVTASYAFDPIFFNAFAKTFTQSSWTVVEW
jgi:Flp pilus assembly protein TadG